MPSYDPVLDAHGSQALVMVLLLGGLIGLVPILLGLALRQSSLGVVGFLFCVVSAFLTGLIGPIFVAIGFSIGIVASWRRTRAARTVPPED